MSRKKERKKERNSSRLLNRKIMSSKIDNTS